MKTPKLLVTLVGLALCWMLGLAGSARAEMEICNDTHVAHRVAISHVEQGNWVSAGWWQLAPSSCVLALATPLEGRVYYLYAEGDTRVFRHDKIAFCTGAAEFKIVGNSNCAARGFDKRFFAKISLTKGVTRISQNLSAYSFETAARAEGGTWGGGFREEVIFQGCRPPLRGAAYRCIFVGGGRKFTVSDDGRTSKQIFASLNQMTIGKPLLISGDWADRYDNSVEIVLRQVQTRLANGEDNVLRRLQGNWHSASDPNDYFTLQGSMRQNYYSGVVTATEFLSVMPFCGEFENEGPYLFTWDVQGGTGLCYVIREVSAQELILTYLPTGIELRYRRGQAQS